jgi:hypothetical protein
MSSTFAASPIVMNLVACVHSLQTTSAWDYALARMHSKRDSEREGH